MTTLNLEWLKALPGLLEAGETVELVTVARADGSTPREAGAAMLVGREITVDTIGGGHLEWQAIAQARRRLTTGLSRPEVVRYNLGARLGQCCGGVVWLVFETLPASERDAWAARRASVLAGAHLHRRLASGSAASGWRLAPVIDGDTLLTGAAADWHFVQHIGGPAFPVQLFGAGHVARALVRQLRPLGAQITWIDTRDGAFDDLEQELADVRTLVTDVPESEVPRAPNGSYFLVMTHSHALDFSLCETIFRRRDFAYFGLIGSHSKRKSFEHRLADRGLSPERLEELSCPIGIAGIVSKAPATIALAVAAEMFQIHEARRLVGDAARPRLIDNPVQPE